MTDRVFAQLPKAVPIAEPNKDYDQARWDLSASCRIVDGKEDITVAFTYTPVRVLSDGTVEEAGERMRKHLSLSTVRSRDGALSGIGKALAQVAAALLAERESKK